MAEIAKPFFDRNGLMRSAWQKFRAFSHPVVPSAHPYIDEFCRKARDVMTLAHEMGHGIHRSCGLALPDVRHSVDLS